MKLFKPVIAALALAAALSSGCAYGAIATAGNSVVITRQDMFLGGMLRKVYVCNVTPGGVTGCAEGENP